MAKKSNQNNQSTQKKTVVRRTVVTNGSIVRTCAFWGMAVAAVLYIVSGLINFIAKYTGGLGATLQAVVGIITLLGNIAVIVAIALPAYGYVSGKNRNWRAAYWVFLIIFVLGVVFGAIPTFF